MRFKYLPAITLLIFSAVAAKSQSLMFKDTLINLGTVAEGARINWNFGVQNDDTLPCTVKLRHICGCTEFKAKEYTLQAGERLHIPVVYNSSGNKGKVVRGIWVDFEEKGKKKSQRISFTATIDTLNLFNRPATDTGICFVFDRTVIDVGTVEEGDPVRFIYRVRNCSSRPLIIERVSSSCGCVSPVWSREPILPGKESEIRADYSTIGRPGLFTKTLSVSFSGGKYVVLTLKGKVAENTQPVPENVIIKH